MSTVFVVAPDGTVTITSRSPKAAPGTAARQKSNGNIGAEYRSECADRTGFKSPYTGETPSDKYIRIMHDPKRKWWFDGYPKEPGVHSYSFEGNMGFVNRLLREFLAAMNKRPGFKVISTNITPFFNGVNCTVIYSIDDYDIFSM